jgi:hypothetical protein
VIKQETLPEGHGCIRVAKQQQEGYAKAIAFIPPAEIADQFNQLPEFWVVLRGDFVLDKQGRAIDAEFVRGTLPTGDRPATDQPGAKYGIQGGLFESWFSLHSRPQ